MAASNVFAGKAGQIRIASTASTGATSNDLGAVRNFEVNVTRDTADATNFDSSGWRETLTTIASWTLTAEALTLSTSATSQQDDLRGFLSSETRRYFYIHNSTAAGAWVWEGWGYVTNWTVGGGLEDVQVSNFEITGDGKITESGTTA